MRDLEQMFVFGRVQPKPFHLPRQVRANGLGCMGDPGGDDRFDAYAILAFLLRQALGGRQQLRFRGLAHRTRSLRDYLLKQVFGCIVPVHLRYGTKRRPKSRRPNPSTQNRHPPPVSLSYPDSFKEARYRQILCTGERQLGQLRAGGYGAHPHSGGRRLELQGAGAPPRIARGAGGDARRGAGDA